MSRVTYIVDEETAYSVEDAPIPPVGAAVTIQGDQSDFAITKLEIVVRVNPVSRSITQDALVFLARTK